LLLYAVQYNALLLLKLLEFFFLFKVLHVVLFKLLQRRPPASSAVLLVFHSRLLQSFSKFPEVSRSFQNSL